MALILSYRFCHGFLGVKHTEFKSLKCYLVRIASILKDKPLKAELSVQGWVKSRRNMKGLQFLDVADGSSPQNLQVTLVKDLPVQIDIGASIKVTGVLNEIEKTKQIELVANNVQILGPCKQAEGYPFIPKRTHTLEYIRGHLHLRPRTNLFSSVLRIRSRSAKAFRNYFDEAGFFEVSTPVLTSFDCEGAGEVFKVAPQSEDLIRQMMKTGVSPDECFFGTKTYLTVSGQMHLEAAARAMGNVFSLGPTFRAENSKSRLHLSEFYMLEAEEVIEEESVDAVTNSIEKMLRSVTAQILNNSADDIAAIQKVQIRQKNIPENVVEYQIEPVDLKTIQQVFLSEQPYAIMTYKEAHEILLSHKDELKVEPVYDRGLGKEHELYLVHYNGNRPVFVTEWPSHLKAFYMMTQSDGESVAAVDLLVPVVGELCGGSVRESCLDKLSQKAENLQLGDSLNWYKDLRRFGNVSTCGFGMGFERYLQSVLNIPNIKDVIPYPRWPHNCNM